MLRPHVLMLSRVAARICYLHPSASWKIPSCPTYKGVEIISASRNPSSPEKDRAHPTGLHLRKKRWLLWKGPNSKSLPALGGKDFISVSAEGAPWQTHQNPKVISTGDTTGTPAGPGPTALAVVQAGTGGAGGPSSQCQPHLLRTLPPHAPATGLLCLQALEQQVLHVN